VQGAVDTCRQARRRDEFSVIDNSLIGDNLDVREGLAKPVNVSSTLSRLNV
jgi:hypothetical protein